MKRIYDVSLFDFIPFNFKGDKETEYIIETVDYLLRERFIKQIPEVVLLDRVEQLNAEFDAWHKEHIGSDQPVMSISIGWEAFDTGTESVKEAFRRADEAMYHAKNACKEAHMKETDAASQI